MASGSFLPSRDCHCERCCRGPILGGIFLLTLGALFLLGEFSHWTLRSTWPVLLIVLGLVMAWQHAGSTEGHIPPGGVPPQVPPPQDPSSDSSQVPHV